MFVIVYLRMYGDCLTKALRAVGKNPWTLLAPMVITVLLALGTWLVVALLGDLSGFLLGFVLAAAVSMYFHFLGDLVATQKATLAGLRGAFARYFWPVVGVMFVLWIAQWILSRVLANNPQGPRLMLLFSLAEALIVFGNPTPEVIYERGMSSGLATITKSFEFVQENWIEWYLPNLLIGASAYFAWEAASGLGTIPAIGAAILFGAYLHVAMVFRGLLYRALDGTSHRQRMFKYRNAS